MFVFTATVFAASNWSFVEKDGYGKETYIDLNSIAPYNGNQNIVRVSFMTKNPIDYYSMLINIETNQWTYFESAKWGYPGQKLIGWEKQELDWANYDREWPVPKAVLSNDHSQPSQQVRENLNNQSSIPSPAMETQAPANRNGVYSSNTATKFQQEVNGLHLLLARPIASGVWNDDVDLLNGQREIRSVAVAKPSTYDMGSVRIKLDNGQYVGFTLSYDGKLFFEGIGCQPGQIQGGILTRYKDEQNVFGKMRFDGVMLLSTCGDGKLTVGFGFSSNKQVKLWTVELPKGARYLTGIISASGIKAEVAFYK